MAHFEGDVKLSRASVGYPDFSILRTSVTGGKLTGRAAVRLFDIYPYDFVRDLAQVVSVVNTGT